MPWLDGGFEGRVEGRIDSSLKHRLDCRLMVGLMVDVPAADLNICLAHNMIFKSSNDGLYLPITQWINLLFRW